MTIEVEVPAEWANSEAYDIQVLHLLRAGGIPAEKVRKEVTVPSGLLSREIVGDKAVFTYVAEDESDAGEAGLQEEDHAA